MTKINGYPHSFYLVGVVIVIACIGIGDLLLNLTDLEGWPATAIWIGSFVLGFAAARRANAKLFRTQDK